MRNQTWRLLSLAVCVGLLSRCGSGSANNSSAKADSTKNNQTAQVQGSTAPGTNRKPIDSAEYWRLMTYIANGDTSGRWPVKNAPLPLPGALLPYNRIVAYYGNL